VSLAAAPVWGTLLWRTERGIERRGGAPLLPPGVVGMMSMRRGLSAAVPFFTGFGGFMFVYALVTQEGLHLGPLASGATIAPMAVAFFAASLLSPRAAARFGARIVVIGSVIQAAGLVPLALTVLHGWPHLPLPVVFAELTVVGFGQGLVAPTLFRVVLADVPARVAGMGSGVLVTTQQASLALGAAVLGGVFLSLVPAVGMADAAAVVIGAQLVGSALVAVAGLRLPQLAPAAIPDALPQPSTVAQASTVPQASTSSSGTAGRPWAAATEA
ncbi:MAG: MFS transporter, partial [Acidimicrobiales bacterium]